MEGSFHFLKQLKVNKVPQPGAPYFQILLNVALIAPPIIIIIPEI